MTVSRLVGRGGKVHSGHSFAVPYGQCDDRGSRNRFLRFPVSLRAGSGLGQARVSRV
jgi:hypothetical protein